jgi:ribosomal protein S18 acetylase RimI-like enzyme
MKKREGQDQNRDAQKIEAATASQNVPAVSLYLKTGFTEAGLSDSFPKA